jgi:tetratricopeptide (TPR) repeat protein
MKITDNQKRLEEPPKDILSHSPFDEPAFLTEAARSLVKIVKDKIQDVLPLYHKLALDLLKAQQYEEALEIVDIALKAIKDDVTALSNNVNFLCLKGEILRLLGRNNDALLYFDRAIKINPNDIGALIYALIYRGKVLLELEKYEEAYESFKQALQNKPQDSLTLTILAEGLGSIGSHYCQLGNYPEALEVLNESLELNQNYALSFCWKGRVLRNLGYNEAAIENLQKAITLNPSLAWAYAELGKTYSDIEEHEKAVYNLQESVNRDPTINWVYADLGENLCQLERYQEALDVLDKALELDTGNETIMENRAIALVELDRYPEALQELDKALKLANPNYTFTLGLQAEILAYIAEYEKSVKVLDKAIKVDSKSEQLFYLKGWVLSKLGKIQEAQEAYQFALNLNRRNLWVHKGIAETYYLLNGLKSSEDEYKKIIEEAEKRTDEFYFDLVGWCYYRLGQYSTAAKFFVQVLSLLEAEDTIVLSTQFDLSLSLMCSERYELALQEYQKGLDMIVNKSAPRRCGLLSVALIDFQDATKNNPQLNEIKQVETVKKLLNKAVDEAERSKREILSKLELDCLTDCE